MKKNPEPRRTLADLIMEKITERGTDIKTQFTEEGSVNQLPEIEPRVKVEENLIPSYSKFMFM